MDDDDADMGHSRILLITGAGISVRSGIQPFRSKDGQGIWSQTLWTNANRSIFRQDPLAWYNEFWLPHFPPNYLDKQPNAAHESISSLCNLFDNICVITQNVDGLHSTTKEVWDCKERLVECHGRLGLFKCIPSEDSDTSEDETDSSDDEANKKEKVQSVYSLRSKRRLVKLGSRRKYHKNKRSGNRDLEICKYSSEYSIPASEIVPKPTRCILNGESTSQLTQIPKPKESKIKDMKDNIEDALRCDEDISAWDEHEDHMPLSKLFSSNNVSSSEDENDNEVNASASKRGRKKRRYRQKSNKTIKCKTQLTTPPLCPSCKRPCPPQALLFDEGYHSHSHYQFQKMESWISSSSMIVFIGTSFAVNITSVALDFARDHNVPVYNFNIDGGDILESGGRLNVENILGDVTETLPLLQLACIEEMAQAKMMGCTHH